MSASLWDIPFIKYNDEVHLGLVSMQLDYLIILTSSLSLAFYIDGCKKLLNNLQHIIKQLLTRELEK